MGYQQCAYMKEQKRTGICNHSSDRSPTGAIEVILKIPCIQIRFLWSRALLFEGTGHFDSFEEICEKYLRKGNTS